MTAPISGATSGWNHLPRVSDSQIIESALIQSEPEVKPGW